MSRRRVLALIFGSLVLVFVIGSLVTISAVRGQLVDDIDDELRVEIANNVQFYDAVPLDQIPDGAQFAAVERATLIVSALGEELRYIPAGAVDDPRPRPELSASRIIANTGEPFTVDSDGPRFRVLTERLEDGRTIALAQPLDDISDTLSSLGRTLIATLFGILLLQALVFWWLLRRSLQPYDEMIDTAQAIAGGDLDRRAVVDGQSPDIVRLVHALNTMLDRVQESFEGKTAAEERVKQFAADASHELRTPLTTISGYSEVYLSGAATDTDSVTKQMSRINGEAARMSRLVNDLLVLTRLDQGSGLELAAIDIVDVVTRAVDDRRVVDDEVRITLALDDAIAAGARPVVVGDDGALQQVFANLLANAGLHAPGAAVDVTVGTTPTEVVVSVTDDGAGMSPDVSAKIFDRFYRASEARTSSTKSSGLGLSIVASIVHSLGGTVTVESAPGAGATFTVRLPVVTSPSNRATPPVADPDGCR